MRILVTGGAGFIGSFLVERLLYEGNSMAIVDDLSAGQGDSDLASQLTGVEVLVADVCSDAAATMIERWRPDLIYHLAAQPRIEHSVHDPRRDATVNVVGTVNVLEAARRAGARRVVAASSGGTVYGQMPKGTRRIRESAARRPVCPYAVSKAAADSYLRLFDALYGLSTVTLLLGNVYGLHRDGRLGTDVISCFFDTALHGRQPVIYGDGKQTRDFVHVSDVVDAMVRAGLHTGGGAFNVGSGVETSVNNIARLVCDVLGSPANVEYRPSRQAEVRRVCLDISRAGALLGWQPKVSLNAGLKQIAGSVAGSQSQPAVMGGGRWRAE